MIDAEGRTSAVSTGLESSTDGQSPVARLHAELAPELRRFVLGVVGDPQMADDVMQATFVKAIEQGHQARPETTRGWLFQVAFREALASRRHLAARDRSHRRLAGLRTIAETSPETGLVRGETIEAVRQALGRIPEDQRRVILARIYEDKTFAQIAQDMGLPLGTVLTRMRRGLEKLRLTLRPGG